MIVVRAHAGQRVGVLGMGRSGLAAAAALEAGGATPVCWDDGEKGRAAAEATGFTVEDLTTAKAQAGLAALIVSPGIAHLYPSPHPAVRAAWQAGVPLDNDIGLFFQGLWDWTPGADDDEGEPSVVAITGSNGKSTTSALIHHILREAGRPAQLGGNIGTGVLALEEPRAREVIVLELSSYQTELARTLAPDVAVFMNLSDDHLDRHGGRGGYFAAKARLFQNTPKSVVGVDEDEGAMLANALRGRADALVPISAERALKNEAWSVSLKKSFLVEMREGRQVASVDLREAPALPGRHNGQNACAAFAACRLLGLGPRQIEPGLRSFPGLAHRLQTVAEVGGVRFVNDSKATNADAAEKALLVFDNIRWIAGGRAKEGGIAPLLPLLERVAKTYLIGEAAPAFARALGDAPHEVSGTLEAAVAAAARDAQPGDTVLLAPACASFDQFPDFEARGEAFAAAVERLKAERAA